MFLQYLFNLPLVASLSFKGVMHTVCGFDVIERKQKRDIVCMQPCECIFLRVLQKKISCSIVMTQWSNLYLFYALNEFNSQQRSVPVHWLGRCVLSDWICSMTATHFLSLSIDFSNRSTLPEAQITNVSLLPHAGAYLDLSSCITSLCAPVRQWSRFVLLRNVPSVWTVTNY